MSWKPSVNVGGREWGENNLAFETEEEALFSAKELMSRWLMVTDTRAVESDQPVNYKITIDGNVGTMSEVTHG